LIVLGVVILLVGGCGAAIYALYRSQLKVNADAANDFLKALRDENYDAAYNKLCAGERDDGTSAEFAAAARAARSDNKGVASYSIKSVNTNNSNGFVTRTAGGTVTLTDGTRRPTTFSLDKENDELCISSGYEGLLNPS
jgi:hypothetical protein